MVKLVSRIIHLNNKGTCIRLCNGEWNALDELCRNEKLKRREILENIKKNKDEILGLTAAIRLFTLLYYQKNHPSIETLLNEIK